MEARAPRVVAEIILPKGVNPEPVILYRGMRAAEDGYPEAGATAKSLGARPVADNGDGDIPVDIYGWVVPKSGGMSVNLDPQGMPPYRRPPEFGGIAKDTKMFEILDTEVPPGLSLKLHNDGHGFIEPGRPMTYTEMQELIATTRLLWRRVEPVG